MNKNELLNITFELSLAIIEYCEDLEEQKKYIISRQLLRSGTSIGANSREAQGAESRADFIHKLKIAYKETEETLYWIELCEQSKNYPNPPVNVSDLLTSSRKLLGKIISTSKKNYK